MRFTAIGHGETIGSHNAQIVPVAAQLLQGLEVGMVTRQGLHEVAVKLTTFDILAVDFGAVGSDPHGIQGHILGLSLAGTRGWFVTVADLGLVGFPPLFGEHGQRMALFIHLAGKDLVALMETLDSAGLG